jgi:hypothetical protein
MYNIKTRYLLNKNVHVRRTLQTTAAYVNSQSHTHPRKVITRCEESNHRGVQKEEATQRKE